MREARATVRARAGVVLLVLLLQSGGSCSDGSTVSAPSKGNGSLDRWYAKPSDMVSRVVAEVLLEVGFSIVSDEHDEQGGKIVAWKSDRSQEIVARIRSTEPSGAQVTLVPANSEDPTGEQLLEAITYRIAKESGRLTPTSELSLEASYDWPLESCISAAQEAIRRLNLEVAHQDVAPTDARLQTRPQGDTSVEVRIALDFETSKVVFTTRGTEAKRAQSLGEQFKAEFELALSALR